MREFFVVSLVIFSLLSACTKIETTNIGSGLIPPVDRVNTFDTLLEVVTSNFVEENIQRVYKSEDHVIGITTDPLFGKTTAMAYLELKPTSFPFSFPGKKADLIADSAVLVLSYRGSYGDTSSNPSQTFEVREIAQQMKNDSAYVVNANIATGNLLGSETVDLRRLSDSVINRFEKAKNQIRIPLSNLFADRFIKQYDSLNSDRPYLSDSLFRKEFSGFAVVPRIGGGNALIRINLSDTNTKLALYYRFKVDASNSDTAAVSYFRFSTGSARISPSANANLISREQSGYPVSGYVNTPKSDLVFIQTSPGLFATIKIPGLRKLDNAIIHRAELIAEQDPDPSSDKIFTAPRFLLLAAIDSVNKYNTNIPNDFIYGQTGPNIETFGGLLINKNIPSIGSVAAYTFNLTRYVQGIVSRKDNSYTLRLSAPANDSLKYFAPYPFTKSTPPVMLYLSPAVSNNIAIGRVRLGGGANTRVPMRLRIIYSKI
jgi:hypothetical protein